jgi:hypothetical protein
MRAWRSRRRLGAGLGLFALLLQLTLSFAHIHPEDVLGAPGIAEAAAGTAPADRDQDRNAPGAPHDDCPICAVTHLAGTVVLPHPPALALPTAFTVAPFAGEDFVTTVIPRWLPFQTRAPPLA